MFIHSITLQNSIYKNFVTLCSGDFRISHIKELFIDVRELANHIKTNSGVESAPFKAELHNYCRSVIEVANFIAHSNRDSGLIERIARRHVREISRNLENNNLNFQPNFEENNSFDLNHAALGLVVVITAAFPDFISTIKEEVSKYALQRERVIFSIMEIMQGCTVKLENDEGIGALRIFKNPMNEELDLYCLIYDTKYVRRQLKNAPRDVDPQVDGYVPMIFPVARSHMKWKYNDHPNGSLEELIEYESYIDSHGEFRFREVTPVMK